MEQKHSPLPPTEYCHNCNCLVAYAVTQKDIEMDTDGIKYTFTGNIAYCNACMTEINIPGISDKNTAAAHAAYCEAMRKRIAELEKALKLACCKVNCADGMVELLCPGVGTPCDGCKESYFINKAREQLKGK